MAEKLLKAKKQKITAKKAVADKAQQIVLVGTYKGKQLAWIKANGIYNYPVKDGDEFDAESFGKIKELWLYADAKGKSSVLGKSENWEYYVFKALFLGYNLADKQRGETKWRLSA